MSFSQKNSKQSFLNLVDLVSDFSKYIMLNQLLNNESLNSTDILKSNSNLHTHDLYDNLNQWAENGIVKKDKYNCCNKTEYSLSGRPVLDMLHRLRPVGSEDFFG